MENLPKVSSTDDEKILRQQVENLQRDVAALYERIERTEKQVGSRIYETNEHLKSQERTVSEVTNTFEFVRLSSFAGGLLGLIALVVALSSGG